MQLTLSKGSSLPIAHLLDFAEGHVCNQSFDAASVSFERFSDLNWDDTAFLNKIG